MTAPRRIYGQFTTESGKKRETLTPAQVEEARFVARRLGGDAYCVMEEMRDHAEARQRIAGLARDLRRL